MPNPEHLAFLRKGVKAWNQLRLDNKTVLPDLSQEDLGRENLSDVDLSEADR